MRFKNFINEIKRDPKEEELRKILLDNGFRMAMKGVPGLEKGSYKIRIDMGMVYIYKNGKPYETISVENVKKSDIEKIAKKT